MDAATGRLLTQLVDANVATICPVNKPHPRLQLIVSGSSRSLYAWRPVKPGARGHCDACTAPCNIVCDCLPQWILTTD